MGFNERASLDDRDAGWLAASVDRLHIVDVISDEPFSDADGVDIAEDRGYAGVGLLLARPLPYDGMALFVADRVLPSGVVRFKAIERGRGRGGRRIWWIPDRQGPV